MKLIYHVIFRVSLSLVILLTVWAVLFYVAMIDEIDDEVDDALENYSEILIIRTLAGYPLPPTNDGSNNNYNIVEVSEEYAQSHSALEYYDAMIYIPEKRETEPARLLKTIFNNKHDEYFELTLSTPTIEKEDLREAILHWIVILYVGMLLTIVLVNVWVFHTGMKPLYVILKWLAKYKLGDDNTTLNNETIIKEFCELNEAMLKHVGQAEKAFAQQKQFISNASHEMQTPLAICSNRLECLVDNTELTEEQLEELLKTKQTLNYLIRLNKLLLFISKIDNGNFPEISTVSINQLINKHIDDYQEMYSYKGIKITLHEDAQLVVDINETLAIALVTNLLKNAYIHNVDKGEIEINITASSISILNGGANQALDNDKIYQRFYQGRRKEGSTGLGLVIVKSICEFSNIEIMYNYINNKHKFTLLWV